MSESLRYALDNLNTYYEEYEHHNDILDCHIKNKDYLFTKSMITNGMINMIDNNQIDINLFEQLLDQFQNSMNSMEEDHLYRKVKKYFKRYIFDQVWGLKEIRENKEFNRIKSRTYFVRDQYNRFKSFYSSQNKYDNMISILKVIERMKSYNISSEVNFEFDIDEEDKSMNYMKNIMYDSFKDFRSLIYIL